MFVLRNQPKGARFAFFGLGLCVFALMPTEIGYQDIASLLARQPGVAERWQKRVFSAAGTIQVATFSLRPSDRNLLAADRDLPPRQPRQSRHRHHGFGDAQFARRAAAALSGRRFSQGRPHAQGRSPGRARRRRRKPRPPPDAAPATEDPATSNAVGEGRQDRRAGAFRRACAARSGTAGRAECAAAGAIRCVDVARSQAAGRSQDATPQARCADKPAPARWLFLQDLEPVLWFVARLARRASSAGSPAKSPSIVMPDARPIPT